MLGRAGLFTGELMGEDGWREDSAINVPFAGLEWTAVMAVEVTPSEELCVIGNTTREGEDCEDCDRI